MTSAWNVKVVHYIDPESMGAFCSEHLGSPRITAEEDDVTCKNCIKKLDNQ